MSAIRLEADSHGLARARAFLEAGQLVGVPTETVYGLAGNALDELSVRQIFAVKGRPLIDPLIVHVASLEEAKQYSSASPEAFDFLAAKFWPGPLTLILPKTDTILPIVSAGLPTVALRCPAHPVIRALLEELPFPLAAPSANPFGYISPTTADHVLHSLGDRVAAVIDGGPCDHGLESTIVSLVGEKPQILREGPVLCASLNAILGQGITSQSAPPEQIQAPGQLARHYSPRTPLRLVENGCLNLPCSDRAEFCDRSEVYVFFQRPDGLPTCSRVFWLTEDKSLENAARNLYALMRKLDSGHASRIVFEKAPENGIGKAINERLRRAAAQ